MDGTRLEYHEKHDGKKWIAIVYPVITLLRRVGFAFTVILAPHFTWLQLAVTFTFVQIMWNYLIYFYPMESLFANRIEIFGELINLVLMYHMLLFTDFVQDVNVRYWIGYLFIGFMLVFISVHLYFMLVETVQNAKRSLKNKCCKKKEKYSSKEAKLLAEAIKKAK